jgi:hypothetical protein
MKYHLDCPLSEAEITANDNLLNFEYEILSTIGFKLDDCFPSSMKASDVTIENKIALRELLKKSELNIIERRDASVTITLKGEIVATWQNPTMSWIEQDGKVLARIHFDAWAIFEEENHDKQNKR